MTETMQTFAEAVTLDASDDEALTFAASNCEGIVAVVYLPRSTDHPEHAEKMLQATRMLRQLRRAGVIRGGMVVPTDWRVDITRI